MNWSKVSNGGVFWPFIRKNGISILLGLLVVAMVASPDAKSFVLRQLMRTGLFNASLDEKGAGILSQSAIDFDFTDSNGNVQHTSSLRGKVVFINFWASWCPPCRAEIPSIEKLYSAFKDTPDIFFLLINEDSDLSAAYNYLEREKYAMPVYRTRSGVPRELYAGTLPTTIVLDKAGRIRLRHVGFADYGSAKFLKELEELMSE